MMTWFIMPRTVETFECTENSTLLTDLRLCRFIVLQYIMVIEVITPTVAEKFHDEAFALFFFCNRLQLTNK